MFLILLVSSALSYQEPKCQDLFVPGTNASMYYRIPAITTAKDGSIIAVSDARWTDTGDLPRNISVMIRRSTDGGKTWSEKVLISGKPTFGCGDATVVTDRKTGDIICMFNCNNGFFGSTPSNQIHQYLVVSHDNGITWTEKRRITDYFYGDVCVNCSDPSRKNWYGQFATSGGAHQLRDGTLMVASAVRMTSGNTITNWALYSNDIGKTWDIGRTYSVSGGDESKVIERDDGVIIMSIRSSNRRRFAYSPDKGNTWFNLSSQPEIYEPATDGDIYRYTSVHDGYDKSRMLHTIPYNTQARKNVSVLLSYDEGKTWPYKRVICPELSGYSSITSTPDGMMHILYEESKDPKNQWNYTIVHCSFDLEWLSERTDTFTKYPSEINWCVCEDKVCKECPEKSRIVEAKEFDSYVNSSINDRENVKYTILTPVPDFAVNLAAPNLKKGIFNSILSNNKPVVQLLNKPAHRKALEFSNVKLNVDLSLLNDLDIKFNNVDFKITEPLSKIEIGTTKVRMTTNSNAVHYLQMSELEMHNYNTNTPLEVVNGIQGESGEAVASIPVVITSSESTSVHIAGNWQNAPNGIIKIESGNGVKVTTDPKNEGKFEFSGQAPIIIYYNEDGDSNSDVKKGLSSTTVTVIIIVCFVIIEIVAIAGYLIYKRKAAMKDRSPTNFELYPSE